MLLIERQEGEGFTVGGVIKVRVAQIRNTNRSKIGGDAPKHVSILRDELVDTPRAKPAAYAELNVHYVEDNDDFAEMVGDALRLNGVSRITRHDDAGHAASSIAPLAATSDEPDLLLVDYQLNAENGSELVGWVRRHATLNRLPTVMLSGRNDDETVAECLRSGASAFMQKPNDFAGLTETLDRVLSFWASPARIA